MAVFIKALDLPESCWECVMHEYVGVGEDHEAFYFCRLSNMDKSITPEPIAPKDARKRRHPSCRLLEVPRSGLIDKGRMMNDINNNQFTYADGSNSEAFEFWQKVWDYVDAAPKFGERECE